MHTFNIDVLETCSIETEKWTYDDREVAVVDNMR